MLSWHPPIGVYIGILAFLGVAVPWLRGDKPSKREKAIWTAGMFLLMWLELRSIYHDQAEHDREQAAARAEQLKSFAEIAHGIDHAIADSEKQFAATMESERLLRKQENRALLASTEAVKNITGGNSFCYMQFLGNDLSDAGGVPVFAQSGRYPVYGIQVRISDLWMDDSPSVSLNDATTRDHILTVGDLPPEGSRARPDAFIPFSKKDEQRFNIFFSSDRNGFWDEVLRMRKVNGQWVMAMRVFREEGKKQIDLMPPKISKDYPREQNGKVDWK